MAKVTNLISSSSICGKGDVVLYKTKTCLVAVDYLGEVALVDLVEGDILDIFKDIFDASLKTKLLCKSKNVDITLGE